MTKKTVKRSRDVYTCDICQKEVDYPTTCRGCGDHYCWDCEKGEVTRYKVESGFQQTGDGYFCSICDANPPADVRDLHLAYRALHLIDKEWDVISQDYRERADRASKRIKKLIP